ncbi:MULTISPECIES: acetyl-CoA C-acetyltransferase [unclassified Microbacterium]|uniref:acetyl-CoA C-acetyltransferase n=1 Tax=unclassified Microbacterium TaxID=2609290 RepID=UPI0004934639|nr:MULTISPECIES: acetyl-CoA C-acetyltransferase [unclassified Microbacterium]MCV0334156.1 acetyl-CoA C-acetyltransferase [Microbacterium sp.]MCV0374316.1 acetyl-CoA C-acetyltransferase [Microbacterium sp.]MCV0389388.1 acetyl-CoA C-acetyltransferase [Microbacterium sp.]MCV0418922.1 acetyl-CoA C-acetyltransferase [Microbacterium sp.]MCV0421228.1 acetyl-CoA C-acetyltransferase [Microbacterium sp.]
MVEAYIIDAVRSPVGRRGGSLSGIHPADLGAHSLRALVDRVGVDPAAIDDVVLGTIDAIGGQSGNVARTAALVAGFPEHVPGVTIDRQCGSSQQAVHFAAQAVMSGVNDLVIAGGLQNMSQVPLTAAATVGEQYSFTTPYAESSGWRERYGDQEISQFAGAEMIAEKWDISRAEMEQFALESHRRAAVAQDEGRFANEIAPLNGLANDEGVRRDTTLERMAGLAPLREGGRITAAVSSQISDASSAVLIASERAVREHGFTPRARIHRMTVRGASPVLMLTAPIPATRHALESAGLGVADIDLFEVNEAFAPVVLAWMRELDAPHEKVNVNGGAIALGHPIGATGTRLLTTMLNELERTGGRYGLQAMCEGGGIANVTIIERL